MCHAFLSQSTRHHCQPVRHLPRVTATYGVIGCQASHAHALSGLGANPSMCAKFRDESVTGQDDGNHEWTPVECFPCDAGWVHGWLYQTQLPHFDGFNSRKAAEFCGPSRLRSRCGAKNSLPFGRSFYLDRLGHGVLAFRAEEASQLHGTPDIKVLPRFSRSDLFKLSLPAPQGVVPKKPKALIQIYFSGQTAEVGPERQRQ
jgi:hypothetical protein